MIAFFLGALACLLALGAGGSWWVLLPAVGFAVPGRIGPVAGLALLVVLLPFDLVAPWASLLLGGSGVLGAAAVLHRLGGRVPWVALPWWLGGLVLLLVVLPYLPPAGVWVASDLALRLRIVVLAAIALVGGAVTYLPRYRNPPAPLAGGGAPPVGGNAPGGPGTTGGLDDTR